MGYFNYFIKCFIRLFTRKYFKFILIFIISFILFFILNNSGVFAYSSSTYGNYNGFSENDISSINNIIDSLNVDYDSMFCRGFKSDDGSEQLITIYFYNYSVNGKLFVNTINVSSAPYAVYSANTNNSSSNSVIFYTYDYPSFTFSDSSSRNGIINVPVCTFTGSRSDYCIYTNRDIYTNNSFSNILLPGTNKPTNFKIPYFITTDNQLSTFDFDYLQISGGSTKYTTTFLGNEYKAQLELKYIYNGVTTSIDIKDDYISYNSSDNTWQLNVPYNVLTNSVVVRNGGTFRFVLDYRLQNETGYSVSTNDLTYNLTNEQENNINEESNKQLQDAILNTGQQTNNNLNNINNNLIDSNVDNLNQNSLPQDSTNDITSDGVNGIFQSIYNAFCVGQPQDIIFPFPFTEKNISLSPSYVRNALEGSGAGFLIIIIQAFWWYLISRFIIKDIMVKINNLKSGNIENIEKTNIRGDML